MADGELVPNYDMSDAHALLGLLKGIFVPVELRVDCTELEMQATLEL